MRGSLMRMWTPEQHRAILGAHPDNAAAAEAYTIAGRGTISRQVVAYWRQVFIDSAGMLASADNVLKQNRRIISPQPDDDIGNLQFIPECAASILVIPDLHAPYQHRDTLAFLKAVKAVVKPDLVVSLGDELDYHALSFHDSDPNLDAAGAELERGRAFLKKLYAEFPQVLVCHSNHGSMVYRRAKAHGIPVQLIKRYREVIFPEHCAPEWSWAYSWRVHTELGDVLFKHQATKVLQEAAHNACNLVVGHNHGDYKIEYSASSAHLYYGAVAGCLIDKNSLAFAYGKHSVHKPILGCLAIIQGRPTLIPMVLTSSGDWIGEL